MFHGADITAQGWEQMRLGTEVKTLSEHALEAIGIPEKYSKLVNDIASGASVIGAARVVMKEGVEMTTSNLVKQYASDASTSEKQCAKEIGLKGEEFIKNNMIKTFQIHDTIYSNVATNRIALQSSKYDEFIIPKLPISKKLPTSLIKEFESGGSWIMTEEYYNRHFLGKEIIGRSDGQFMTSSKKLNWALKESNGDIHKLEKLCATEGWQGKTLYRIDIKNPLDYNPRLPHSGLSGANENFIPGGITKGNMPEIVTDLLPKDQLTVTKLN